VNAIARRVQGYTHEVELDGHHVVSDEPPEKGGNDEGPSSSRLLLASLAACTATTVEMYADRKGWELGSVEVEATRESDARAQPVRYSVEVRIPAPLTGEQAERIKAIAAKCPVHRALTGEVEIEDRVDLVAPR
jgi:putative redox protein